MLRTTAALMIAAALGAVALVAPPAADAVRGGPALPHRAAAQRLPAVHRGPAPTVAALARNGPFKVGQFVQPRVSGLTSGRVFHPTSRKSGRFPVVAVSPGLIRAAGSLTWLAGRLASHGFVVVAVEGEIGSQATRKNQTLEALAAVARAPQLAGRIDTRRQGIIGWSSGGGAVLEAAQERPDLRAVYALTPHAPRERFGRMTVPTFIFATAPDTFAPAATNAETHYASIPAGTPKALLMLKKGDHFTPTEPNRNESVSVVAWMKLHLDGDTRYRRFFCPGTGLTGVKYYRSSCTR